MKKIDRLLASLNDLFFQHKRLFTGFFVAITIYISWHIIPGDRPFIISIIAILATLLGSKLENIIFGEKS